MYAYKKKDGMAIGDGGYDIYHENGATMSTALWKNGIAVAVLVVKPEDGDDNFEDMEKRLYAQSDAIVEACNGYPALQEQNKALVEALETLLRAVEARAVTMGDCSQARSALAAAGAA